MKKIMIAATMVGALFTASVATAQKAATNRKVDKKMQMAAPATNIPAEQKAPVKVSKKAAKGQKSMKQMKVTKVEKRNEATKK